MSQKILATACHPGAANAIAPVLRKIQQDPKLPEITVVAHNSPAKIIFAKAGIVYKELADYGLSDVSLSAMKQLLQKVEPDLVLTGTSSQAESQKEVIEQTLTLAAKELRIQSLAVLDFWGNYTERFSDIFSSERFQYLPDKIAVMDVLAIREMVEQGFPRNKLVITGNPYFDNHLEKARSASSHQEADIRRKLDLGSGVITLYAGNAFRESEQNLPFWDMDIIRLICLELLGLLPTQQKEVARVIVTLHPRMPKQEKKEIRGFLQGCPEMVLAEEINTIELIPFCSTVFMTGSTVGLEAIYMNRPSLSLQPGFSAEQDKFILTRKKLIPVGYTKLGCRSLIKRALTSESFRRRTLTCTLKNPDFPKTDYMAGQRVLDLVLSMLEASQ